MIRRIARLSLAFSALVLTGAADLSRCCTLEELSRPASTEIRDCCGNPDCCSSEKRGPAPALFSKAPETAQRSAIAPAFPALSAVAAVATLDFSPRAAAAIDRPPPLDGQNVRLRIALFRI